mgnify:CR=1 FL=1
MFRFAAPYYLFLLAPVAAATLWTYRRRAAAGLLFAATDRLPRAGATWRARLALFFPLCQGLGLALAVAALARPQTVLSQIHRRANAIAIEMVVDVSGSMEALDMSEISGGVFVKERTRLDAVKETFAAFIQERPDDLIGLVTFGGYAATRAPLTADHNALLHTLKGVEIPKTVQDRDGEVVNREELMTAIGDALATACARLERAEPKSKIIVLLSDGESNTGIIKPEQAAAIAKKMGLRVYTIGVGTTGTAPFRVRDRFGRPTIQAAQVSLDEDLLRRIAATTGGKYFNVRDPDGLKQALDDIGRLEKTAVARDVYYQADELFLRFLIPALALLAAGAGLNVWVAGRIV